MDEKITYIENYQIKSSEANSKLELSVPALLKILQDLSVSGAEYIGVGVDRTTYEGLMWVYSNLEININRMPKYMEKVILYTYPNEMVHFIYPLYLAVGRRIYRR